MENKQAENKVDQIRVNIIVNRTMYKKLRSKLALKGDSLTKWMKGKMAEEIESPNPTNC